LTNVPAGDNPASLKSLRAINDRGGNLNWRLCDRLDPLELAHLAVHALASKRAIDPVILDLRGLTIITDYFVIATGSSSLNVHALADGVLDATRKEGIKGVTPEGMSEATWVLIDLGDVVVHIFDAENRDFYQLERLWADAVRVPLPEEAT
jgi:ribosome-associated protein